MSKFIGFIRVAKTLECRIRKASRIRTCGSSSLQAPLRSDAPAISQMEILFRRHKIFTMRLTNLSAGPKLTLIESC